VSVDARISGGLVMSALQDRPNSGGETNRRRSRQTFKEKHPPLAVAGQPYIDRLSNLPEGRAYGARVVVAREFTLSGLETSFPIGLVGTVPGHTSRSWETSDCDEWMTLVEFGGTRGLRRVQKAWLRVSD
jgi:hypothetical protein